MSEQPGEVQVQAVEFLAELKQVKSTVDHGFIVSLIVGEDGLDQVKQLMGMTGDLIRVVLIREASKD